MKKILQFSAEYFQIALGILLTSIGLKAFLLPNGFLDGGATGIAILMNKLFGIDVSFALVIISLPFLLLGYLTLSKRLVIKSIFSVLILAIMIHLENFPVVTEDKLLIAIFGGLFVGSGIGLAIRNGAVLDASEILGIYFNSRYSLSIGQIVITFNLLLFGSTAILVSLESALYSVLTFIVAAKVIDFFIEGFEDFIGVMVVSPKNIEIQENIKTELGAGMTIYTGKSGYGKKGDSENMDIIHVIINRIDLRKIHKLIDRSDSSAFVVEFDVNNVRGGILRRYLDKSNLSKPIQH